MISFKEEICHFLFLVGELIVGTDLPFAFDGITTTVAIVLGRLF
jgi:predicted tellurium resistance membrane protein TerC